MDKPCSSVPGFRENQSHEVNIGAIRVSFIKMDTRMKPMFVIRFIIWTLGHSYSIAATEISNMIGVAIEYKSG